jgi:hypothetical protein
MTKLRLRLASLLLGALFVALPQVSHAVSVSAVQCAVQQYPCLPGNIIASGALSNGINLLPGNTFTRMNYTFGNAAVSFTGSVMATDVAGAWTYLWATGTATDLLGGALTLDVAYQQLNYATIAGGATYNDMIIGGCAGGTGANSGAIAQGVVNATGLSVIVGNCSLFNPFASVGNPVGGTVGAWTSLTAAAEFVFTAGSAAGSTVTLPWGDDFPDPSITGDPNSNGYIDPTDTTDINNLGLQVENPEPGTFIMMGGAGLAALLIRRRRKN